MVVVVYYAMYGDEKLSHDSTAITSHGRRTIRGRGLKI
jgi:hypothetical protein